MQTRWKAVGIGALLALVAAGCSSTPTTVGSANSPPAAVTTSSPPATSAAPTPRAVTSSPPSRAAPPPAPPAPPPPPAVAPATVVEEYFAAIDAHDYNRAWVLGGDHLSSSYAQFAAGFANTAQDAVTIVGVSGDTVAIDLTATNTDGSQQVFAGTYTVSGQAISSASVSQVAAGGNGASLCGAPANPYGYNFCGNGSDVRNPPADICTYFNCIDSFRDGNGFMVECNDGMYSMSGGISGACSYHGGESRRVYSGS